MNAIAINQATISAQNNWWGACPPNTSKIYADNSSSIDYSGYLNCTPNQPFYKTNTTGDIKDIPEISGNTQPEDSLQLALLYMLNKKYKEAAGIYKLIINSGSNPERTIKCITGLLAIFRQTSDQEIIKYLENLPEYRDDIEPVKLMATANAYAVSGKIDMAISSYQIVKNKFSKTIHEKWAMIQTAYLNYYINKKSLNDVIFTELDLKFGNDDDIQALRWFVKGKPKDPKTLPGDDNETASIQNYPNPFNPSTVISFVLRVSGYVSLKVYDVLGREVRIFVNGYREAGKFNIPFDSKNLSSGTYLYQLNIQPSDGSKAIILTKNMQVIK